MNALADEVNKQGMPQLYVLHTMATLFNNYLSLVPRPNFSHTHQMGKQTDGCSKNFLQPRFSVRYVNVSRKFGLGTRLQLFLHK